MEYIDGEKFIELGDDYFCSGNDIYLNFKTNVKNNIKILYTHNQFINDLFPLINNSNEKIILVSHNTDTPINEITIPNCIVKWYCQNVNFKNDKIESIPIGLENNRWFPHINKKNKILNKCKESKNIKNLVYLNFNIGTNTNERLNAYNVLKNKKFVTVEFKSNGDEYDNYIDQIYNHKFVVCPEGNGIDTHRTWETLYLNSIPIEKRNINNSYYSDLPICFVNDWSDITEEFLENEYEKIYSKIWNLEKLDFKFWKKKIINSKDI